MSPMKIVHSACSSCLRCEEICLFGAVTVMDGEVNIDEAVCSRCGACLDECPMRAIVKEPDDGGAEERRSQQPDWLENVGVDQGTGRRTDNRVLGSVDLPVNQDADLSIIQLSDRQDSGSSRDNIGGICLYLETNHGRVHPSALQVIGAAKRLKAVSGMRIYALLIGEHTCSSAVEIARCGVDEVRFVDQPGIGYYAEDVRVQLLTEWLGLLKPEMVLAAGLRHSRSIMARAAARLHTGLCADCIDVRYDSDRSEMVVTRTGFGGAVMASIHMPNHRPQMATLKEGAFEAAEPMDGFCGHVAEWSGRSLTLPSVYEVLEIHKVERWLSDFDGADIIVSAGRGIGKAGHLPIILNLAEALGAKVGATRAVVESGWLNASHQIGQSGKVVKPRVYIACGISGALQHIVGIEKSGMVIAINTERNAPIFQYASHGFVGDLLQIVPRMTAAVKERNLMLKSR